MTTTTPLVSVIIPTYNSNFSFLEQGIRSVKNQIYKNIELIIVDDCSSDPSVKIRLIELQKKYDFKLIFLDQNSGSASKPLNTGIKSAQGKYIAICAHDDYYLPNKIEVQVNFLEQHPEYMMAYCRGFSVYKDFKALTPIKNGPCKSGFIFPDLFLQKFYVLSISVMIQKEVFESIGYFDEHLFIEDWDMWLRIAYKFQIGFIDQHLIVSRQHDLNISLNHKKMQESRKQILNKWKQNTLFPGACAINRSLDGDYHPPFLKNLGAVLSDSKLALINLKQPYRVFRLLIKNILLFYKRS